MEEADETSSDEPSCRICMEGASEGRLFSPCKCRGSMRFVHVNCLQRWRLERGARQPSYYRCEQCRYEYSLKRVDAAGLLRHAAVLQLFTGCLLVLASAGSGLLWRVVFGPKLQETVETTLVLPPAFATALVGLGVFGTVSFLASFVLPQCQRTRPVCDCDDCPGRLLCGPGCGGHGCPAGALPLEAGGGEAFLLVVVVAVVAYMVVVGFARAVVFTHGLLYAAARSGADALETTVLDIGEGTVEPPAREPPAGERGQHGVGRTLPRAEERAPPGPQGGGRAAAAGVDREATGGLAQIV